MTTPHHAAPTASPGPGPAPIPGPAPRPNPFPPLQVPPPGRGWRRRGTVLATWILLALAAPLAVLVVKFSGGNGGWLLFAYVLFGWPFHVLAHLLPPLLSLLVPSRITPEGRRRILFPLAVDLLLATGWVAGVLGLAAVPDAGDAPDSGTHLDHLDGLLGAERAAAVMAHSAVPLVFAGIAALTAAAVLILVVAVVERRARRRAAGRTPAAPRPDRRLS